MAYRWNFNLLTAGRYAHPNELYTCEMQTTIDEGVDFPRNISKTKGRRAKHRSFPDPSPFNCMRAQRRGSRAGMWARIPLLLSVMANEPQARDE